MTLLETLKTGILDGGWEIVKDWSVSWGTSPQRPCPHCYGRTEHHYQVIDDWTLAKAIDSNTPRRDEVTYTWTCPRVLVVESDAHDFSAICLNCLSLVLVGTHWA